MKRVDELKAERLEVEEIFKLEKCGLFMEKYRFTRKAVAKFVYANVLMLAILIRLGFMERVLQKLAEWCLCRYPNFFYFVPFYFL